jgi:hypothetical protein
MIFADVGKAAEMEINYDPMLLAFNNNHSESGSDFF